MIPDVEAPKLSREQINWCYTVQDHAGRT